MTIVLVYLLFGYALRNSQADTEWLKLNQWYEAHGDYEMINHIVEFEPDRLIGWEPQAGNGHPAHGAGGRRERWGHRWSYQLTPDGPGATIVTESYDCSRRRRTSGSACTTAGCGCPPWRTPWRASTRSAPASRPADPARPASSGP